MLRVVLLVAALLCASLHSVSAQDLTNVSGSATCNFTSQQNSIGNIGIVQMLGYLTINLTAGSYNTPNTPGFAGQQFFNYPITAIAGTRTVFNLTVNRLAGVTSNIVGIGANRRLYSTFNPLLNQTGFNTDGAYIYRLDYTGITINTDSSTTPVVNFAEVNTQSSAQYSDLALLAAGGWNNASFSLSTCTFNYTLLATTTPTNTTRAVGDPQFTGFLGQRFQIHGMADTVYSILSDAQVQLNALFVFLSKGECPVVDGRKLTNCWSHPGSYFGSLALQTAQGDRLHIASGSHQAGFTLTLNDQPLTESISRAGLKVTVENAFSAVVEAGLYRLRIENSDQFVNLASVEVLDWKALRQQVQPHGLLGQTWRQDSKTKPVEGNVDDYAEADNKLFGSKFLFGKFGQ